MFWTVWQIYYDLTQKFCSHRKNISTKNISIVQARGSAHQGLHLSSWESILNVYINIFFCYVTFIGPNKLKCQIYIPTGTRLTFYNFGQNGAKCEHNLKYALKYGTFAPFVDTFDFESL